MKKASISQLGSFWAGLFSFFLSIKNAKKIEKIEYSKLQEAINREDKMTILEEVIKFINNGCRCTRVIIAQKIIDFEKNWIRILNPVEEKILERSGVKGKVFFLPQNFKAVHKLKDDEKAINSVQFLQRLKDDPEVTVVNYNMLDFLNENQDEPEVKEFLDAYRGKALFAFGDIIAKHGADKINVMCRAGYIHAPIDPDNGRWEISSRDMMTLPEGNYFWALVMKNPK